MQPSKVSHTTSIALPDQTSYTSDRKYPSETSTPSELDDVVDHSIPERYRGTNADRSDMVVLGKRQVLRRNFKLLTMTGFASMVVCAWEGLLPLSTFILIDGGPALLFWGFWCVAAGMTLVYLSMAEIASM